MSPRISTTNISPRIKQIDNQNLPNEADTKAIDLLSPMLDSAIDEMHKLAQKKPDEPINITKINILNRLLKPLKDALSIEPGVSYLDLLESDSIPTNSDIVLILGQYEAVIEQCKSKHFGFDGITHRWFTKENPSKLSR
jgi:hypothetical protein